MCLTSAWLFSNPWIISVCMSAWFMLWWVCMALAGHCMPAFSSQFFFLKYQESKTSNLLSCIGPGTLPFLFCVSQLNLNWQSLKFQPKTKKKIFLTKALLGFGTLLHWSEVPFLQLHVRLKFKKKNFSSQPVLVSVTRVIFWLNLSPGHSLFPLIMVFLNLRDWWKASAFCKKKL